MKRIVESRINNTAGKLKTEGDVSLSRAFYGNYFVFYLLNTQIGHFAEIHSFSSDMYSERKVLFNNSCVNTVRPYFP